DVIGAIVSRGVASGEFTVAAADDAVLALSSLCVDVCRWFPSRTHRDPEALGHAYGDLAVRMVR
ncbi:TetR family transcriptional regulator, partial [Streptomyces sp. SID10244]|nr:TetR family transcriptional regulator [Streptomyces sp. SID10244]